MKKIIFVLTAVSLFFLSTAGVVLASPVPPEQTISPDISGALYAISKDGVPTATPTAPPITTITPGIVNGGNLKTEQELISNFILNSGNISQIALAAANKQNSFKYNSEAVCEVKLTATVLPYITQYVLDYSADKEYPVGTLKETYLSNDTMTFDKSIVSNAENHKATLNSAAVTELFNQAQQGIFVHYNKYTVDPYKGERIVYVLVLNIRTSFYQEQPEKTIDFACYENFAFYLGIVDTNRPFVTPTPMPQPTRTPTPSPSPTPTPTSEPTLAPTEGPIGETPTPTPTRRPQPTAVPPSRVTASAVGLDGLIKVGEPFAGVTITYTLEGGTFLASIDPADFEVDGLSADLEQVVNRVDATHVEVTITRAGGVPLEPLTAAGNFTLMLQEGVWVKNLASEDAAAGIRPGKFELVIEKGDGADIEPSQLMQLSATHESVTITVEAMIDELLNPGGQTVEYAISKDGIAPPAIGWKAGRTFTGLDAETTYYVWARAAENNNYEAGTSVVSTGIFTSTEPTPTPSATPSPTPTPIQTIPPNFQLKLSAIVASCLNVSGDPSTGVAYSKLSTNPFNTSAGFWANYTLNFNGVISNNVAQTMVPGEMFQSIAAFPTGYESATELTNIWLQNTLINGRPANGTDEKLWDTNVLSKYVTFNKRSILENVNDMIAARGDAPLGKPLPTPTPEPTPSSSPTTSDNGGNNGGDGDGGGTVTEPPTGNETPTATPADPTPTPTGLPNASSGLTSPSDNNKLSSLESTPPAVQALGGSLVSAEKDQMFDPTKNASVFLGGASVGYNLGNILIFGIIAAVIFTVLAIVIVRKFAPKGDGAFVK